jgi:hypothetical protein
MNKLYKIFAIASLCMSTYSFADVESTRKVLSGYAADNQQVLEVYDDVSKTWAEYEKKHVGQWDLEKLLRAVEYAAEKHVGQVRKDAGKTPYIIHPIGVAKLLWEIGSIRSINVLTSALLHDTLEDTNATEEEIEALFGPRVLDTVKELTNDPSLTEEENKQRQIDHAVSMSFNAQLVKLTDRLYNVRDLELAPPSWSAEKIEQYYAWGEKLLAVLIGTNEALEKALEAQIKNHVTKNQDETTRSHTVIRKQFEFDPYEGNYIDEYIFTLDDGSKWRFDWFIYEINKLNVQENDIIEIKQVSGDEYFMIITLMDGKNIVIKFKNCGLQNYFITDGNT